MTSGGIHRTGRWFRIVFEEACSPGETYFDRPKSETCSITITTWGLWVLEQDGYISSSCCVNTLVSSSKTPCKLLKMSSHFPSSSAYWHPQQRLSQCSIRLFYMDAREKCQINQSIGTISTNLTNYSLQSYDSTLEQHDMVHMETNFINMSKGTRPQLHQSSSSH